MKVAIIGTGNIGTDLLIKLLKNSLFQVVAFVGRRPSTKPLPQGVPYFDTGIDFFIQNPKFCDIVFDCTDAYSALKHSSVFQEQDVFVIDMTPSKIGRLCVPTMQDSVEGVKNVNMITCGGQVSIPLIQYIASKCTVTYAEVVTQISSESAGMATRINIDKYIDTTEYAIKTIAGVTNCKVILNVNPCSTTIMQTTVFFKTHSHSDFSDFETFVKRMKSYVPYYQVKSHPKFIREGVLMASVSILGSGDYLSKYAGNLDVINCAAIEIAKLFANKQNVLKQKNEYDKYLDI
jgi:acetaldehyde dehydrogenase